MKFSWLKAVSIAIAASTGSTLVAVSLQARAQAPAYHLSDEGEAGEVAPAAVEMAVADSLDAADYTSELAASGLAGSVTAGSVLAAGPGCEPCQAAEEPACEPWR